MLQWFMGFLIKKTYNTDKETGIKSENKKFAEELHKPIYKNLKNEKYTYLLKIIFVVLI